VPFLFYFILFDFFIDKVGCIVMNDQSIQSKVVNTLKIPQIKCAAQFVKSTINEAISACKNIKELLIKNKEIVVRFYSTSLEKILKQVSKFDLFEQLNTVSLIRCFIRRKFAKKSSKN
jgi:hypothetical protein